MIDEMVGVLHAEQQDDDDKKEYCAKSFDLADDKKKSLERSVSRRLPLNSLSAAVATIPAGILMFSKTMNNAYLYAFGQHVYHTSGMSSIIWCPVALTGYTYNYVFVEFNPGGRALSL